MPRTHLFAVAVENYQGASFPPIPYAEQGAREFVAAWQAIGVDPADCVLLLGSQATLTAVTSRLRRFLEHVGDGDRIILFYAGHGTTVGDASYLTAHDTQPEDFQNTRIPLSDILTAIRQSRAAQVLLFFDTCHSDLSAIAGMRLQCSPFAGHELAAFCDAESRVAFASCQADEVSYPSLPLKQGIWTYSVVRALGGHAPTALAKGALLTARSLQNYLQDEVPRLLRETIAGPATQTPCAWGDSPDLVVADLGELLSQRKLAPDGPTGIIQDARLTGFVRGRVRDLRGYKKPKLPLSTGNQWEQDFVEGAGEAEVDELATALVNRIRDSFGYKRKDLSFKRVDASASIKTPDFDVNVTLAQDPDEFEHFLLRIEVASFRRPQVVEEAEFLSIFSKYCNRVVIDLASPLDLAAKIDAIEDIAALRAELHYDPACTEFTLRLPDSGIVLHATTGRMTFSLEGGSDLAKLIANVHQAIAHLAGDSITLGLPEVQARRASE